MFNFIMSELNNIKNMIFTSSKDRTASRNFVGSSIDYGQDLSSFHNNRST